MSVGINQEAPDFELPDLGGKRHRLSDYRGRIAILNFWSSECPHSERADRLIMEKMQAWGGSLTFLTIASNQNETVEALKTAAEARHLPRVLIDRGHHVADLYEAQTTPHVFLIDRDGILRYRGAVDDVTFRQRTAACHYLLEAVESLMSMKLPVISESPAYGCAIVREI